MPNWTPVKNAYIREIPHDNIHEINTRTWPIQTQCGQVIYSSFMLNIVWVVLTWAVVQMMSAWFLNSWCHFMKFPER